ncbi:MAG: cell division topological specificity factor MinE [Helicobacter sp.]|nr:cell division topological specificity factor MinE [Helicobacter sp.]MDE7195673.1 cell division topological specificity factor MinE [Helicobacter sp.]MDE7447594.1 cell division topological specificity factor MinE [Helicobacter sp.]
MMGFFGKKNSAAVAHDRLRLVLERERQGVPAAYFDAMREEIVQAVRAITKKYTNAERIEVKNQDSNSLEIEIILEKKTL